MNKFEPGTTVRVKDFNCRDNEFTLGELTVAERSESHIYLEDQDGQSIRLKLHLSRRTEWLFHTPHFMITPA